MTGRLGDLYRELEPRGGILFVAPQLKRDRPTSDYLSLVYNEWLSKTGGHQPIHFTLLDLSLAQHYRLIASGIQRRPAILHYHWLEFQSVLSAMGMLYRWISISLFHHFGGRIVWTVHNLNPHGGKWIRANRWVSRKMAAIADVVLVHCEDARIQVSREFRVAEGKIRVHSHPTYPVRAIPEQDALNRLNVRFGIRLDSSKTRFLSFGHIAAYKQIPELARMILSSSDDCQFLVAGQPKPDSNKSMAELKALKRQHPERIFLITEWIGDEDLPAIFGSCTVCVFNHRDILASGGVYMALAFSKTVIAPKKGCISEMEKNSLVKSFASEQDLKVYLTQEARNGKQ